jgi:eukaryotic-like serine/threonine-protein kinase
MAQEPRAQVGAVLDATYCIEEYVGGGAMGDVFRVRELKTGRQLAVKMLHGRLRTDAKIQRRFAREAEMAAKLRHPNVVGVIDVRHTGDAAYMVMDYAPGRTLGHVIATSAPLPQDRVMAIIRQLLDGLDHAHDAGLIHRDLKPDNVIVELCGDREVVRIVDFGIAIACEHAASRDEGRFTTDGVVLGTPQYMAPELATGRAFDHRVDLFALGVICFQMLTGTMPFEGSGVDVALANVSTTTPPMGVRAPDQHVDPLLEAFTRKLLAKRAENRYPNAAEARRVLDLIATDPKAAASELMTSLLPCTAAGMRSPGVPDQRGHSTGADDIPTTKLSAITTAKSQAIEVLGQPIMRGRVLMIAAGVAAASLAIALALSSC